MYKDLFLRVKNILLKPADEWKKIFRDNIDANQILAEYLLPLIGICTLASFISVLINLPEINFEVALKHALVIFMALFGGLYLAFLIAGLIFPLFRITESKSVHLSIIAFSSTPFLIVVFLVILFPEWKILYLASLYSYYIIWQGVKGFPGINANSALTISTIIAFIIHFLPFFVQKLFVFLFFKL